MEFEERTTPIPGERDLIFALDIGTRSVIGVVGVPENGLLRVLAVEELQHTHRAVIDGQIEDIGQTAIVAQAVKEKLEQRLGITLRDVCIAAAGRALKTQQAEFEISLDEREPILDKQILELETGAIQAAYDTLKAELPEEEEFLCVGHSVMNYWLDGYVMSTLLDHRGRQAKARIIATFLPSEVVESLYAVMMKIGLTVGSMTLEPIAAMNAVIPRELRMLNLALVDIGGGTSDIAISDGGSVVAYTMATIAGDEITEAIMRECLVDFQAAEKIKLELSKRPQVIEYQDILGFSYEISEQDLLQKIQSTVEQLAEEIANRILATNGHAPSAVFLVGGGSQLPMLCPIVAQKLGIDEKKVAVGGSNYMKRMVVTDLEIAAPEYATPVGIAVTAMSNRLEQGISASVNGRKVVLLRSGASTVLELLLMSGCQYSQIMGRSGANVVYEYNGERRVARGEHSIPAEVRVNGSLASVSTPVHPDDQVTFVPAQSGADAAPTVGSVVTSRRTIKLLMGGTQQNFSTRVFVNGLPAEDGQQIRSGDRVETKDAATPADLFRQMQLDPLLFRFRVNGIERGGGHSLEDGDVVEAIPRTLEPLPKEMEAASAESIREAPAREASHAEGVRAEPGREAGFQAGSRSGAPLQPQSGLPAGSLVLTLNGEKLSLSPKADGTPYQFVDLLNFVDVDLSKPQGNIILTLNGRNASYLDPIHTGDQVTIQWDQSNPAH